MGDWSEYFEDFPEENPANYDKQGRYDPNGQLRAEQKRMALAQRRLDEVLGKSAPDNNATRRSR